MDRAVILFSGGLDSATCLWWAKRQRWELNTISYNYFRRTDREIRSAENLVKTAEVREHKTIDIPFLRDIEDILKFSSTPLPEGLESRSSAYIPARNLVFYGMAASWAETLGAAKIVGGHNRMDFDLFPDSTPKFFEVINEVLRVGTWSGKDGKLEIIRPLEKLDKAGILKLAIELRVPLELTWSCYRGRERACGTCDACIKRLRAFEEINMEDPLDYEQKI